MGKRITIDPITRIEGHLRIDVEVEGGKVTNAWSSGQMYRGIENMLTGRDPRDAHHFVQRSCGVCTYIHALSSVRAVEDALDLQIPENARIIRNLLHGAQYQHDHIVHFYHLHALDWVDIVSALSADPVATAKLSANTSGRPESAAYFKKVKETLQTFVNSGQLGPFNNGYWGHPAMKLPPEGNLMASAHYLEALQLQAKAATMHAILGGKNPHPQSLVVGGVTLSSDLTIKNLENFENLWKETKKFIDEIYIPDLMTVASFYKDWGAIGGNKNFLAYGEFPLTDDESKLFFPSGYMMNADLKYRNLDDKKVTEDVSHGWYEKGSAKHPYKGETKPLKEDVKHTDDHYSWSKAPRYEGAPMEVGPLARVLIAYSKGDKGVQNIVNGTLKKLGVGAGALFSTLGRTAARGLETVLVGNEMGGWLNQLKDNISKGKTKTYQKWDYPKGEIRGRGLNDVPRGALGHWIIIKGGKIKKYQYVVPTTWNMSPRDAKGVKGPYENALIGTPIADPKRPLEVLRTIHSFDPCIACAVHVIDPHTNETYKVKVL
jgi:[NiFe] hydrogenase large subunit